MKVRHVMYVSAIAAMLSGGCGSSTPPAAPTGVVADTSAGALNLPGMLFLGPPVMLSFAAHFPG